jgi:hypothetical protein
MPSTGSSRSYASRNQNSWEDGTVSCRLPGRWDQVDAGFAMSILSLRTPRRRENWAGLPVDADPFLGV